MELMTGSFRRSYSKLGRSSSSLLLSETITAECARIAAYERLSESMRLPTDYIHSHSSRRSLSRRSNSRTGSVASFLAKVFGLRKDSVVAEEGGGCGAPRRPETEVLRKKMKKRSWWLPDPDRRWPVQGW